MASVSGLELWQWRAEAYAAATASAVPPVELDWFLQALTDLDRLALRLGSFKDATEVKLSIPFSELTDRWQQRLQTRIPVQYLAGTTAWRNFSLAVSPAVLIPRPETEGLIDLAIAAVAQSHLLDLAEGSWVDLGTGSGAIALGLAVAFPKASIYAVDASRAALEIAKQNAQTVNLAERIKFYQGHWLEPLQPLQGQLSGLVSNPPYIPSRMIAELQPEVAQHEPRLALDGGADGLDCIRHLIATAPDYLRPGGVWLIEMMAGQAPAVTELLQRQGDYQQIQIYPDLAGVERFALAYRAE